MPSLPCLSLACLLAVSCSLAGCSGAGADPVELPGESDEQAITGSPGNTAFALQFADHYAAGTVALDLYKNGTFKIVDRGATETGTFRSTKVKAPPVQYQLRAGAKAYTAVVKDFTGTLELTRAGATTALKHAKHKLSDEELCDNTSGHWTDDDPDPKTGLYCICGGSRLFIPSAGGCVTR